MVWLGCAAVLALAPAPELTLALVLLRVPALGPVPELGPRPLLGLLRPVLSRPEWLRWQVRSGGLLPAEVASVSYTHLTLPTIVRV